SISPLSPATKPSREVCIKDIKFLILLFIQFVYLFYCLSFDVCKVELGLLQTAGIAEEQGIEFRPPRLTAAE
ncbi:MAG: hypothetical protein WBC06_09365, partial [Chitinophagaceae bacterium]